MRLIPLLALLLLWPSQVVAQVRERDLPPVLTHGLEAFKSAGFDAALDAWLEGWDAESAEAVRSQFRPALAQFDTLGGRFKAYEAFAVVHWGQYAQRVYLILLYERRAIYGRMDFFQAADAWRVLNITFNTDPNAVFPPELLIPATVSH